MLATAGAVVGGALWSGWTTGCSPIDVTPRARRNLSVRGWCGCDRADGLDDFAVDPVDGLLYGVNSRTAADVVSVDPGSGAVRIVATPAGLPHGSSYGAAVIDSSRHAVRPRQQRRSPEPAVRHPHGGPAHELTSAPPVGTSDAARLPRHADAATATSPPPPSDDDHHHHAPGSAPPPSPTPPPPSPSPAPVVVPPPPPSQRPGSRADDAKPWTAPKVKPVAASDHEERTKQRRWR